MSTQRKGLAGRRLAWVVSNGGFAWALWAWHAQGNEGARHLATGWVWFGFVASFLLVLNEDAVAKLRERGPSVPIWLNGWVDAALVMALMWWGDAWLASAYLVHALLVHGAMTGGGGANDAAQHDRGNGDGKAGEGASRARTDRAHARAQAQALVSWPDAQP